MWSKKYDSCVKCGTVQIPHCGKGLCIRCYSECYRNNPLKEDRVKKQKREWYDRNGGKYYSQLKREEKWFSSKRDFILKRDGYRCTMCNNAELLVVHHVDRNGRGHVNPNNDDDNLITLCRACHASIHHTINQWARKFKCCVVCGRTDIRHNAHGYCVKCYCAHYNTGNDIVRPS